MTTIDYSKFEDAPTKFYNGGISPRGRIIDADEFGNRRTVATVHWLTDKPADMERDQLRSAAMVRLFVEAPTLLARCKALEEALQQSEKFIRDYLRDSGGCDHDVGICECDTKRLLDSVVAALAANKEKA